MNPRKIFSVLALLAGFVFCWNSVAEQFNPPAIGATVLGEQREQVVPTIELLETAEASGPILYQGWELDSLFSVPDGTGGTIWFFTIRNATHTNIHKTFVTNFGVWWTIFQNIAIDDVIHVYDHEGDSAISGTSGNPADWPNPGDPADPRDGIRGNK